MEITEEMKELEKSTQIEDQWKLFLMVSELDKRNFDPKLMSLLKRCFYGGMTQLVMLIKFEFPKGTPDEAVDALESISNQTNIFWQMMDKNPPQQN